MVLVDGEPNGGITSKSQKSARKTPYTLHGLRVSGITAFIEAGVPLHVIAEFVSGHANLVMTLYYTKLQNFTISEQLQAAAASLDEAAEDKFMKQLSDMSEAEFGASFLANETTNQYRPDGAYGTWTIQSDGFCVAGQTLCHEGGTDKDLETGVERTVPIVPSGFNCVMCKFYTTGTAFLPNQVALVNSLMCVLKERGSERDKIVADLKAAKASKNARKIKIYQSKYDTIDAELTELMKVLGTRIKNVYQTQELLEQQKSGTSTGTAIITKLDAGELRVQLEETKQYELLEWAAQSVEFFNLTDNNLILEQRLLEKWHRTTYNPSFHLDEDVVMAEINSNI